MALLHIVGYGQTKLLGKTNGGNLGLKRSGLTEEKDPKGTKQEAKSKQKFMI